MKIRRLFTYQILSVIGALVMSSCSGLMYTTLDVMRPAEVVFAPEAQKLLIINNSVPQPAEYGHKLQQLNVNARNISVDKDSLALFCLGALHEGISQNEFFRKTELQLKSANYSRNFLSPKPLDSVLIKSLCKIYDSDVILSLDRLMVNDVITEYQYENANYFVATFVAFYESQWSIQYPDKNKVSTVVFKDTLYWESESFLRRRALAGLPKHADALIDGALYVGRNSVNRIIPYWDKTDRYLFTTSNKLMKKGFEKVVVRDWNGAISDWTELYTKTKSKTQKGKAAYNTAIAYEISGDLENAVEFALRAANIFADLPTVEYKTFIQVTDYLDEVRKRKREIDRLKIQLGE